MLIFPKKTMDKKLAYKLGRAFRLGQSFRLGNNFSKSPIFAEDAWITVKPNGPDKKDLT